jgi:dihydrolipoamide dehydrogenase
LDKVRAWKNKVIVSQLTGGLGVQLCKQRKIKFIQGRATFLNSDTLTIEKTDGSSLQLSLLIMRFSRPAQSPVTLAFCSGI